MKFRKVNILLCSPPEGSGEREGRGRRKGRAIDFGILKLTDFDFDGICDMFRCAASVPHCEEVLLSGICSCLPARRRSWIHFT